MVSWTYLWKKISSGRACATGLAKFAQSSIHEIYDLRAAKLKTNYRNGFISPYMHLFHVMVHLVYLYIYVHWSKKLTIWELCVMVRWTYSLKEISNSWGCATNLTKFSQNLKHKIYDLRLMKLKTDFWNRYISTTHIFFMYNLFWFKPLLCWFEVSEWRSVRKSEHKEAQISIRYKFCITSAQNKVASMEWPIRLLLLGHTRCCFENRMNHNA
jgi:hypothetical protein